MVINTGSRTDIPAYYSKWFYNRIREGCVLARNPYYPSQVSRYRLTPEVVDCLIFCTKNPEPMLGRLGEIRAFGQLWFVTITPYGKEIEPHVPDKDSVLESFKRLSDAVGANAVCWRYDPIFISDQYTLEVHTERFGAMAEKLKGFTESCVISFIDLYAKTRKNFPGVRAVTREEQLLLGKRLINIGRENGMVIRTCCEGTELGAFGADTSGCMTREVIEHAIGCSLEIKRSGKPAREGCSCLLGNDIGSYNTCGHGCVYCYANYDQETVLKNMRLHDPDSPLLIGQLHDDDEVREAKQESFRDGQLKFFF